MLSLVTGGIKSGKSVFAEKLSVEQNQKVYYVATAVVTDSEMQQRVEAHQKRRPASWKIIEESYALDSIMKILPPEPATILIDCLTTYLTNRLWKDYPELFQSEKDIVLDSKLIKEMTELAKQYAQAEHHFIVVSNEVGLSLIPPTKIGRIFCDLQGKVNQIFAENAEHVFFTVSGIPIKIK